MAHAWWEGVRCSRPALSEIEAWSMEHALLSVALLLTVAKLAEGVAVRLGQSPLIAYILAGIALGPALGVVQTAQELSLFFSIGVYFLFFLIGIDEIDISGFVATLRGRFFLAAVIGFLVPFALGLAVAFYVLDIRMVNAIAVAGLLALSSLGVVAKVLSDLGHLRDPLGLEVFTTVVMVELIGLLVVGFTMQEIEAPGRFTLGQAALLLAQIAGFTVVAYVLASRVLPPAVLWVRQRFGAQQLTFGLVVGLLFLVVLAADTVGLHGSLGALLFGTALSGLPQRLRAEIMPGVRGLAQGFFIPLFFASAGLHFGLSFLTLPVLTILAVVGVAVLGKVAGSFAAVFIARLDAPLAVSSGLMAKGVVEIALLLVMVELEAITPEVFSLLTLLMLAYIIVMPPLIGAAFNHAKRPEHPITPRPMLPSFARYAFDQITAADVMHGNGQFPTTGLTIKEFMEKWLVPDQQDYLIVTEEGSPAGVLSLRRVDRIPTDRWEETSITRLVRRRVTGVWLTDPIPDVLEKMAEQGLRILPVFDPKTGDFVGGIRSRDAYTLLVEQPGS